MQLLSSIKDFFETDSYYVISPSEQACLILQSQTSDYEERLLSLSSKLPFNLHKFNYEKKSLKLKISEELTKKINELQKNCRAHYKEAKPKTAKGRTFKV